MVVWVRNLQSAVRVCESLLKLHCTFLMNLLGAGQYHVNVVCMDGTAIRSLNRRYRSVDAPTDVLAFPYHENLQPGELPDSIQWDRNLGDIILGMPVIQQACTTDRVALQDQLPVIVTHGFCHLIGYHHDDHNNCTLMYKKEKSILKQFNANFGTNLTPLTCNDPTD